jgi:hypothetical protein
MAKGNRKPQKYEYELDEDWFADESNECSKQDMQKIRAIEKREYKNKRSKSRKQWGEYY